MNSSGSGADSSLDMSVVLVTTDTLDSIRRTIECLRRQSAANRLELVIVAPAQSRLTLAGFELGGLARALLVELENVVPIARANAAGVRAASAPVVALAEDHSYPDPGWAATLIQAHACACAAAGPVVRNANPATAVSWADFYIGYGPWSDPAPSGFVEFLPGHNSSYKRDVLLGYGARLEDLMEAETLMHWDLRARGHQLYLESAARTSHVNFSRWSSWLQAQFHNGRVFAGTRIAAMSGVRRIVYIVGSPLIPMVRFRRVLKEIRKPGRPKLALRYVLPTLSIGLICDGVGQLTGYVLGSGDSKQKLARFEFHRERHLSKRDRDAGGAQDNLEGSKGSKNL
jgi:hypothetical protein